MVRTIAVATLLVLFLADSGVSAIPLVEDHRGRGLAGIGL